MKRTVIEIDEKKCNGCGICVNGCPEGAIQLIDSKARLVADNYCDGLGACIGECPEGAISTVERDAASYDECAVLENIIPKGSATIEAHLRHLYKHGESGYLREAVAELTKRGLEVPDYTSSDTGHSCPHSDLLVPGAAENKNKSVRLYEDVTLSNWPVQLKLLPVQAPFFNNADLLIAADCTAFACSSFHSDFLLNRITVIFCPKLDQNNDDYVEKMALILRHNRIRSIEVLRMEVPCCGATTRIIEEAVRRSGNSLNIKEIIIGRDGSVLEPSNN